MFLNQIYIDLLINSLSSLDTGCPNNLTGVSGNSNYVNTPGEWQIQIPVKKGGTTGKYRGWQIKMYLKNTLQEPGFLKAKTLFHGIWQKK